MGKSAYTWRQFLHATRSLKVDANKFRGATQVGGGINMKLVTGNTLDHLNQQFTKILTDMVNIANDPRNKPSNRIDVPVFDIGTQTNKAGNIRANVKNRLAPNGDLVTAKIQKSLPKRLQEGTVSHNEIGKLLREIIPGYSNFVQIGHADASVLLSRIANMHSVLESTPGTDPRLLKSLVFLAGLTKALDAELIKIDPTGSAPSVINGTITLPKGRSAASIEELIEAYSQLSQPKSWDVKAEFENLLINFKGGPQRGTIGTLTYILELKEQNQQKGTNLSATVGSFLTDKLAKGMFDELEKHIEKYDLVDLYGSDSIFQSIEKIIRAAVDPLAKPYKGVGGKHSAKVTQLGSLGFPKAVKIPRKIRVPKVKPIRADNSKVGGTTTSINLIAIINAKLQETLVRNMSEPALVNRTGRFASSVHVTDVITTPQGFPSVGYTYDKNPYQIFDMTRGTPPWATPERDPKILIDRSIREIAVEYVTTRLYTRSL